MLYPGFISTTPPFAVEFVRSLITVDDAAMDPANGHE
jgi:hypothetical protein